MGGEPHLLDIDLTTAGVPHARYAELRRAAPVCWQEAPEAGARRRWAGRPAGPRARPSRGHAADGRLDARVFLEEFFGHFEGIELAGEPARLRSTDLHTWKRMPVRLRPRGKPAAPARSRPGASGAGSGAPR